MASDYNMAIYRKLIKQIYILYAKDKNLKRYMVTVLKQNAKLLMKSQKSELETLCNDFSCLFQILLTAQNKKPIIETKKQLHLSFISIAHFQLPEVDKQETEIRQLFYVLGWVQFYYMLYFKKIFPKKVIGDRGVWTQLLSELNGKISWGRDTHNKIDIIVPRIGDKLTAIL